MNAKKKFTFTARHQITPARLTAFLRVVAETSEVMAVKSINEDLDEGRTVEELFSEGSDYDLTVTKLSKRRYQVQFGCRPGPDCGDGGEWLVTFAGDTVDAIEPGSEWIS